MISVFEKPDTPAQALIAVLAAFLSGFCLAAFMQKFTAMFPRFIWAMMFIAVNLASYFRRFLA